MNQDVKREKTTGLSKGSPRTENQTGLRDLGQTPANLSVLLQNVIEAAGKLATNDAHAPAAMAKRAEAVGETKGKLDTINTILLGILAGVFIALGAMFSTVITTSTGTGFGITKLLGGLTFSLGLILVVVAGAELFTGNTLIVMSWISGRTSFARLMRNWGLVYLGNLVGALSLVGLMFLTRQWALSSYGVGANALNIANAKVNLTFMEAFARGIVCNALVCLAVWLCFSARTVTDKILAIIFPITAFVAAGFEHSIANMYFIPLGILLSGQASVISAAGTTSVSHLTWMGFLGNLVPVTLGNIIGGSVLIGAIYWVTYLRQERTVELVESKPWVRRVIPTLRNVEVREPIPKTLAEPVRIQIEELIRANEEVPVMLDRGGKALLSVLTKARDDAGFITRLSEDTQEALKDFDLTTEEKAALSSGDIQWIESKLGHLDEPLRGWLDARLAQEKW